MKTLVLGGLLVIGALAVGSAATYVYLRPELNNAAHPIEEVTSEGDSTEKITRVGSDGIELPPDIVHKMELMTGKATACTHSIALPSYQGVLALDNDRLSRVHARFKGEIVEMGKSTDGSDPTLRVGEHVNKGDLLAVIWSTELGQKKSDLVDALTKLRSEEQLRDRLKKLFDEGAGAGRAYRDAEKDVQVRLVEIANLERTLRTWRVTEDELASIRTEAKRLSKADELKEATMPEDEVREWARVEIRAPISGMILEKNAVVGDIVDTDSDLFKIGDLNRLAVWAHVYEEDLPVLESLPHPIEWVVTLPSRPGEEFNGKLEKIGAVIDPTQHTALVTGHVENPSNDLKIGQFVNVTVQMPPPKHEVVLPATAVVEDGRDSVVFVQPDPKQPRFLRRVVHVLRRFRDEIYVKSINGEVQPGDVVVTSGALMLQNALDQLPSSAVSSTTTVPEPAVTGGKRS